MSKNYISEQERGEEKRRWNSSAPIDICIILGGGICNAPNLVHGIDHGWVDLKHRWFLEENTFIFFGIEEFKIIYFPLSFVSK